MFSNLFTLGHFSVYKWTQTSSHELILWGWVKFKVIEEEYINCHSHQFLNDIKLYLPYPKQEAWEKIRVFVLACMYTWSLFLWYALLSLQVLQAIWIVVVWTSYIIEIFFIIMFLVKTQTIKQFQHKVQINFILFRKQWCASSFSNFLVLLLTSKYSPCPCNFFIRFCHHGKVIFLLVFSCGWKRGSSRRWESLSISELSIWRW